MKRFFFAVAVLLLAEAAFCQETYDGITLNAAQVASLNNGRVLQNTATCGAKGLPSNCTQAQACVAYGLSAACTAGEANAAGCRIYNNNLGGRQAFIIFELIRKPLAEYDAKTVQQDGDDFRSWCRSASQAQQDALCTLVGKSAGCFTCLAWR